jgi:hypothetical protein
MFSKLNELLQRMSHPHPVIEYILAGVVLLSTTVSIVGDNAIVDGIPLTTVSRLLSDYSFLPIVFVIMSLVALIHLAFLSVYPPTRVSVKWRSRALGVYTIGFMFVSVLEASTFGFNDLLWLNELAISLIAAVLRLNLKVNYSHASE